MFLVGEGGGHEGGGGSGGLGVEAEEWGGEGRKWGEFCEGGGTGLRIWCVKMGSGVGG